jgi:hypothetical protein
VIRSILGIIIGLVVMAITIGLIEVVGHRVFATSTAILLSVLAAYFLGALLGGLTAGRIAGARWPVWVVVALVVAGAAWSLMTAPHPLWMFAAAPVAPVLGGFLASHLLSGRIAGKGGAGART